MNQRLNDIGLAKKAKTAKTNPTGNIGTAKAARFCESVQETLAAWKYPLKGNVSFDADPKKIDLVMPIPAISRNFFGGNLEISVNPGRRFVHSLALGYHMAGLQP